MEPFIRSDQYNFIRAQTQILINGHAAANDIHVIHTLKNLAQEKVQKLFVELTDGQRQLINPILTVKDKTSAEAYLAELKAYVIPFKLITEQTLKKLFPKAKKLKLPLLEEIDLRELSYLGWNDKGSNKKFIIAPLDNRLKGLQGTFTPSNKKGICALCNGYEELGLFMSETKGSGQDNFIKRGNYICRDSLTCNHNLTELDKLHDFIGRLTS
ncbi:FusB/FusC family EF-G-binding protein [Bacillus sp. V59.32b]|uniref:FusB/FusC family EF-G-binding protein n=1 Tax=Bacillus sp. V59.32b TaxID=1758642 RepID=UPI000E3E8ABB|nr:FusB/FusC family EF-G-binding protein [Bacillus sp. V59.32b]RFU69992.1 elongation factor G-binding protein [Bacillus sp. V59.32b]